MYRKRFKRIVDMVASVAACAILSPVLVATAIAIWLEDGCPFLFRQTRVGRNGVPFVIFKSWVAGFPARGFKVAEKVPCTRLAVRLVTMISPTSPAVTPQQQVSAVPPFLPALMDLCGAKLLSE